MTETTGTVTAYIRNYLEGRVYFIAGLGKVAVGEFIHNDRGPGFTHFDGEACGCNPTRCNPLDRVGGDSVKFPDFTGPNALPRQRDPSNSEAKA